MDLGLARHISLRTTFGATPAALARLRRQEPEVALAILLDAAKPGPLHPQPPWAQDGKPWQPVAPDEAERQADELRAWWLREMLETDSPLTERLILGWHDHFALSLTRVAQPRLLAQHLAHLRAHALGDVRALFKAVLGSAAAVYHLDNHNSHIKAPSARLAHLVLTRWALPPNAASDEDKRALSRAFTGYQVDDRGRAKLFPLKHDEDPKTFLGRVANFGWEEAVEVLTDDPRFSEHVAALLWSWFVTTPATPTQRTTLGTVLREASFQLKPLLAAILTSPEFLDPQNHLSSLKSPIELLVGLARTFYFPAADAAPQLVRAARALGQDLLNPPEDDQPWPTGLAWLPLSPLFRRNLALDRLLSGGPLAAPVETHEDLARWLGNPSLTPDRAPDEAALALLGASPLTPPPPDATPQELLRCLVGDPLYQLT